MSRIIAAAAIRGAHKIIDRAENSLTKAIEGYGKEKAVEFPNTGYFLPVIYGMTGMKVETLADMETVMGECRNLLPPLVKEKNWFPFLGWTLDAGMATLFAEEIIEAIKYLDDPDLYVTGPEPTADNIWLGAANDIILRERGIEFVDGTAPGFAAIVGAAPTNEWAVRIARELQEKNLYVFMAADNDGVSMAEQLHEEGVQLGWPTRLVSFGKDISATVFALGFATRAALSFGGIEPGDYSRILMYNRARVFAFVLPLMAVDDEKYANAAGAINWGFPVIAHTDIPEILPTGICMYEHVVSNIPLEDIVAKAVEVRGLKVQVSEVDVPVPFGPAFEGETVRKDDMFAEFNSIRTPYPSFEYTRSAELDQIEDGKIEVVGPELDDVEVGAQLPLAIIVDVAGRQMQPDFEPILERMIHTYINEASGVLHMGQRDLNWIRVSKEAYNKGFRIHHFGTIIHARYHEEYGAILDKVQVTIYTEEEKVKELLEVARQAYRTRDDRMAGLTDEAVEEYYSCTLCQSFAPNHVCIITPERSGLCGGYTWLDGKANYQIVPTGPNQPVRKGSTLSVDMGEWDGVNEFLKVASRGNLLKFKAYSMMEDPMTSCGCFECISVILPLTNGIMIVDRDCSEMTPCGMKFSTLAGMVGGGRQTPGFIGHSKMYISSKKFISGDGGFKRIAWMPKMLKEQIGEALSELANGEGIENFLEMIADETTATTEDEVMEFMMKVGHPALEMEPMMG